MDHDIGDFDTFYNENEFDEAEEAREITDLSGKIAASGLKEARAAYFSNVKKRAYLSEYDGQPCVVEHILTEDELFEYGFDEPEVDVIFGDGKGAVVSISSLSPATTLYHKFTDPKFLKRVREEYDG